MNKEITISKEEKELFKQELTAVLTKLKQARTEKVDTPENLKEAEVLVKSSSDCIGGTFKSNINVDNVDKLEEKIKNNKNKSTFVTKIKEWAKKFAALCRNPSSLSKKRELQKETEVLIKGHPVKIINATLMPKGTLDMQKELKARLIQTAIEQPKKRSELKRSKPVSKEQKENWEKNTDGRNI